MSYKNKPSLTEGRHKGLGDDIAWIIERSTPKRLRPRLKQCGGCGNRRKRLNKYPSIINKIKK